METIKLMVNLLLQMLLHDPNYALQFEIPARKLPVRMWYMYKNKVCTLIDVDEVKPVSYTHLTLPTTSRV